MPTKKKGGEFFTPREVVSLLVNIVNPKEGMRICDPTCGSGGMLIVSRKYVEQQEGRSTEIWFLTARNPTMATWQCAR